MLGWAAHRLARGAWLVRTPLDRPVLAILLMLPVALATSADLRLGLPRLYGVLLGVAVCYATATAVTDRRRFWLGVGLLVASLAGVSLVGLVGTGWAVGKLPALEVAYARLPRLIRGVQASQGQVEAINPAEVGGALALLLPVPVSLLLGARLRWAARVGLFLAACLGLGVLVLAFSRTALVGSALVAAALLGWLAWRDGPAKRLPALFLMGAASLGALLSFSLQSALAGAWPMVVALASPELARQLVTRAEIWARALELARAHPFTGVGLNTFTLEVAGHHPFSFATSPTHPLTHAHNAFLQTTVDLGFGGLLALVGLFVGAGLVGWRALGELEGSPRAAVAGLLFGLSAYLGFGLTDAVALGAKPTVLLWLMLGLVVAARGLSERQAGSKASDEPDEREASADRPIGPRERLAIGLWAAWRGYWAVAYLLVALGYLALGLRAAGLAP